MTEQECATSSYAVDCDVISHLEVSEDCNPVGDEMRCDYGCERNSAGTNGMCIPEIAECGVDGWEIDKTSSRRLTTCPSSNGLTSFEHIMSDPEMTNNLLISVEDDQNWFRGLMEIYLFAPTSESNRVKTQFNGDIEVSLPRQLADFAVSNIPIYTLYTCSYNLPTCADDSMQIQECLSRCHRVSDAIGEYYERCLEVYVEESANLKPRGTPACDLDVKGPSYPAP